MKHKLFALLTLLALLFAFLPARPVHATGTILYVDDDSTCTTSCGDSWTNAYPDIQSAQNASVSGDQIWVAKGVYYPGTSTSSTFFIYRETYGGFDGSEDQVSERVIEDNPTILSGDIGQDDTDLDGNHIAETPDDIQGTNAIHVVTYNGPNTSLLDGFIITAGSATSTIYDKGGGVYNYMYASPVLKNVTIIGNTASQFGGGIYTGYEGNITLENVTITGNTASQFGGGMEVTENSNPILTNVTISGNASNGGAGLDIFTSGSNPVLTNVTIAGNNGYGIFVDPDNSPTLKNTLIADNTSGDCFGTVDAASSNNVIKSSANACGLTNGVNGNIVGSDPSLGPLADNGGVTQTHALLAGSVAIDTGTNTGCPSTDQRDVARPIDGDGNGTATCDIGSYEYKLPNSAPTDITLSNSSVAENEPAFTPVGAFTTTDPDAGDTHTYSFCGGADDGSFVIGMVGLDSLHTFASFDYETKNTYSICVRTDDGKGGTFDKNFTISVTDVNEPPTDISLSNSSVAENQPIGTTVGTLTTTDPDAGDTHTYPNSACTVPGADDVYFAVNGNTLVTNAVFDFETKNSYSICIRTDDGNGGTFDKNFTINVTDVVEGTFTFRSTGTQDGWILETGENTTKGGTMDSASTTLRLGDDLAKKQYRSILSFATGASLPDNAVITKVTLKVKKQGITGGGNPVTTFQGFMVDIKRGLFGTSALQAADFQTRASKTYGPFTPALASGWYGIDLSAGVAYINKLATSGGLTQIRLRFKLDDNGNTVANYLSLHSGDAGAASRPQLIIEYYVP